MNRLIACLGLALALLVPAAAALAEFDAGIEYTVLERPQPTVDPERIEVRELFWYACPHCWQLEPKIQAWLEDKPDDVVFVRYPAIPTPRWEWLARVYFAADALDVLDKIHEPLFHAIHEEHRKLDDEDAMAAFFAEHGVPEEDFRSAVSSFAVLTKVNQARSMTERYNIRGVPSIVVNGKYLTSASQAGGNAMLIKVMEHLVEKERQGSSVSSASASD